jgi:hypothetical protein
MVISAMTEALEPELAAAYVRELSADIVGVVVLDADGTRLAGPEAMAEAARELPRETATYAVDAGTVWVAVGPERTVVAAAGPASPAGPTALDAAVAVGSDVSPPDVSAPEEPLKTAVSDVIAAT